MMHESQSTGCTDNTTDIVPASLYSFMVCAHTVVVQTGPEPRFRPIPSNASQYAKAAGSRKWPTICTTSPIFECSEVGTDAQAASTSWAGMSGRSQSSCSQAKTSQVRPTQVRSGQARSGHTRLGQVRSRTLRPTRTRSCGSGASRESNNNLETVKKLRRIVGLKKGSLETSMETFPIGYDIAWCLMGMFARILGKQRLKNEKLRVNATLLHQKPSTIHSQGVA